MKFGLCFGSWSRQVGPLDCQLSFWQLSVSPPCLCEDRPVVDCQVVLPTLSLLKAFLADSPPLCEILGLICFLLSVCSGMEGWRLVGGAPQMSDGQVLCLWAMADHGRCLSSAFWRQPHAITNHIFRQEVSHMISLLAFPGCFAFIFLSGT